MLQSILIGRFVNSLQRDVFSQFVLRSFIELVPFPDVSNHRQTDFSKEPLCSVFLAQGHNIIESDLIFRPIQHLQLQQLFHPPRFLGFFLLSCFLSKLASERNICCQMSPNICNFQNIYNFAKYLQNCKVNYFDWKKLRKPSTIFLQIAQKWILSNFNIYLKVFYFNL